MVSYSQAQLSDVFAAGVIRLAQFGTSLVAEEARRVPNKKLVKFWEDRLINLRQGLEYAALEKNLVKRDKFVQHLMETYGLIEAFTDPLLRPVVPMLSAGGNKVVPVVLNVNGFNVIVNGFLVGLGAQIVANTSPTYNTQLEPDETAAGISYKGMVDTMFAFDGPVPDGLGTAPFLRLFVDGVQVGRVDFPDSMMGRGFSLYYEGNTYYGMFQTTLTNELSLT